MPMSGKLTMPATVTPAVVQASCITGIISQRLNLRGTTSTGSESVLMPSTATTDQSATSKSSIKKSFKKVQYCGDQDLLMCEVCTGLRKPQTATVVSKH